MCAGLGVGDEGGYVVVRQNRLAISRENTTVGLRVRAAG